MPKRLSLSREIYFEEIIKGLKSRALLHEDDPIIKGFYKILVSGIKSRFQRVALCEGLLSKENLILILKKPISSQKVYEIIPYEQIKEVIYAKIRTPISLAVGLGATVAGCIGLPFIIYFLWRMPNAVLSWFIFVLFSLLLIGGIAILNIFIRGIEILYLEVPDEQLILRYSNRSRNLLRNLIIFERSGGGFEIQSSKATMEQIYELITKFTTCPTTKDDRPFFVMEFGKLNKNISKKVALRNQNSPKD